MIIKRLIKYFPVFLLVVAVPLSHSETSGISDAVLVDALRSGGYNIYFRHAQTDWSQSDRVDKRDAWLSCDPTKIRQLSEHGRKTAIEIGKAMRTLGIPVHRVLASPYCRTVETAELLDIGKVDSSTDIVNLRIASYFGGESAIINTAQARLAQTPPPGFNIIMVAHGNVARRATQVYPGEAEALVFQPKDGHFELFARIPTSRWNRLVQVLQGIKS